MATLAETLAVTSSRQIEDKGRPITLRLTELAFDPATGESTPRTIDSEAFGLFTEFAERQVDGSVIQAGDKLLLIAAEGLKVAPKPGYKAIDGADAWNVEHVSTVQPGPTAILYKLRIRR